MHRVEAIVEPFKPCIYSLETRVDLVEPRVHVASEITEVRVNARKAVIDLLVEVVEPLVGLILSRHHHHNDPNVTL